MTDDGLHKPEGNTAHSLGPDRLIQPSVDPYVLGAHLLLGKLLNLLNIKTFVRSCIEINIKENFFLMLENLENQ